MFHHLLLSLLLLCVDCTSATPTNTSTSLHTVVLNIGHNGVEDFAFGGTTQSQLVDKFRTIMHAQPNHVSYWAQLEAHVNKFTSFLSTNGIPIVEASTQQNDQTYLQLKYNLGETGRVAIEAKVESDANQEVDLRFLNHGRPPGDQTELESVSVNVWRHPDQATTDGKGKHTEQVSVSVSPITTKQQHEGERKPETGIDKLPFTSIHCVGSPGDDQTCRFDNIYYHRGRWVVHADGQTLQMINARSKKPQSKTLFGWALPKNNLFGSGGELFNDVCNVRLSPRSTGGFDGFWRPFVEADGMHHMRACRSKHGCKRVVRANPSVMLVSRTEPETFGHILVDTVYALHWAANRVQAGNLDAFGVVFDDPYGYSSGENAHSGLITTMFPAFGNHLPRNGDPLCDSDGDVVCLFPRLVVGVGGHGLLFDSHLYVQRSVMAANLQQRALTQYGKFGRTDLPLCLMWVTIIARGGAHDPNQERQFSNTQAVFDKIRTSFLLPVRVVYMELLNLNEQLGVLRESAVVVAMDGSALDLTPLAMREGTSIVTIVPSSRTYSHWRLFQALARNRNHYVIRARDCDAGIFSCHVPVKAVFNAVLDGVSRLMVHEQNRDQTVFRSACKNWRYLVAAEKPKDRASLLDRQLTKEMLDLEKNEKLIAVVLDSSSPTGEMSSATENTRKYLTCELETSSDRHAVLRMLILKLQLERVLEIGCTADSWKRFGDDVVLKRYVCVDPLTGQGEFRVPSDIFFATLFSGSTGALTPNDPNVFDLVFVDGLHTASQARKDIDNALKVLAPGGIVAVHDTNPRHELEGDTEYYGTNNWNGDVWRAIASTRTRSHLDVVTLPLDWGITLIRKIPSADSIAGSSNGQMPEPPFEIEGNFEGIPWDTFTEHRDVILNTVSFAGMCEWLLRRASL